MEGFSSVGATERIGTGSRRGLLQQHPYPNLLAPLRHHTPEPKGNDCCEGDDPKRHWRSVRATKGTKAVQVYFQSGPFSNSNLRLRVCQVRVASRPWEDFRELRSTPWGLRCWFESL